MSPIIEDEVQHREIGDLIKGVQDEPGAKGCSCHIFSAQGIVKALRMCEHSTKLHKINSVLLVIVLISIWFKGGSISDVAVAWIKTIIIGSPM